MHRTGDDLFTQLMQFLGKAIALFVFFFLIRSHNGASSFCIEILQSRWEPIKFNCASVLTIATCHVSMEILTIFKPIYQFLGLVKMQKR